jgi:uroporphyrinogen decarboxylase
MRATRAVLADAAGRPGHILNLGHGVDQHTAVDAVEALVAAAHAEVPCAT